MGVVTDFDGKFFIEVPEGTSALLISFVGYEEETDYGDRGYERFGDQVDGENHGDRRRGGDGYGTS